MGEGPGAEEVLQGYPFIGPSGKLLAKVFKEHHIDRNTVWISNALLCPRPPDDTKFAKAVECCRPRLEHELAEIKPTAILALGGTAARALKLQANTVMEARGTVQESPLIPQVPVVTSIHPAAILRGGAGEMSAGKNKQGADAQVAFLAADIVKAWRISRGEVSAKWSDDITVVTETDDTLPAMRSILADIRAWGALGIDLEWSEDGRITWCGLGTRHRAVSFWFPTLHPDALALAREALADATLSKIIHNLQADKEVWEREVGPVNGRIEDSMHLHAVAYPGIAHDLQQVVSQYLPVPPWKTIRRRQVAEAVARAKEQAKIDKKAAATAHNALLKAGKMATTIANMVGEAGRRFMEWREAKTPAKAAAKVRQWTAQATKARTKFAELRVLLAAASGPEADKILAEAGLALTALDAQQEAMLAQPAPSAAPAVSEPVPPPVPAAPLPPPKRDAAGRKRITLLGADGQELEIPSEEEA